MDYSQQFVSSIYGIFGYIFFAFFIFLIISNWVMYQKAGQPGWTSLIPIYYLYVLMKIVGRPGWWLLLFLIPFVNIVISIIVAVDLAKSFGKSGTFGIIGLFLFSFIGYSILAFGNFKYLGPAALKKSSLDTLSVPSQIPEIPSPPQQ